MAITLVGAGSVALTASSGTLTVSLPAGVQNGDVLLFMVSVGGGAHVPATPSGLIAIDNQSGGPSVADFYRVASSEPASYAFTVANNSAGVCIAYRGVDNVTPINGHSAFNRLTSTSAITGTTITTTVNGCQLVLMGGLGIPSATYTATAPAGFMTQAFGQAQNATGAYLADMSQTTAGATGSVSATFTPTGSLTTQGSIIALAPSAGSAPVNTVAPVVSGTATQGSVLSTTNGTWTDDGSPTYTYQWTRDGSNISSATSSTYTSQAADVGHAVGCKVTDSTPDGNTTQASSNTITVTSPSLSTIAGKTGTSGTAVMQKTKSGWTYVSQSTHAPNTTAIDQKGAGTFTKVKGH